MQVARTNASAACEAAAAACPAACLGRHGLQPKARHYSCYGRLPQPTWGTAAAEVSPPVHTLGGGRVVLTLQWIQTRPRLCMQV